MTTLSDLALDPRPSAPRSPQTDDRAAAPQPDADTAEGVVAVVGLGYVGLPTALALAQAGRQVIGVDPNHERLVAIRDGCVDLSTRDLERLDQTLAARALSTTTHAAAVAFADAVVICVPTPVDEHFVPDLTAIRGACAGVVEHLRPGTTVILTSTTYVGSTRDMLAEPLRARGLAPGEDVHVVFSPERINPGVDDHAHDEVPRVVGGVTPACTEAGVALVARMTSAVHPVASAEAAEMTKLYENTFRAVNIALANEMAEACGTLDLDVIEVIEAAATKPYGFMPFYPGPGVGGHCIPCDPHYLTWQLRRDGWSPTVVETAMSVIAARPRRVVERALDLLADAGRPPDEARVLVLGVAYKPGVEDVRESPALTILAGLARRGVTADYHDPYVPTLVDRDGNHRRSVEAPDPGAYDLTIVHTLHPGVDQGRLAGAPVLDATYRCDGIPDRAVV